jgi:two-component system cell cycle response regulator DivK
MADRPYALIVEDDPESRVIADRIMKKTGFNAIFAVDGVEALQQIATYRPRLVLLDLSMPRLDGWEVARRVRQHPEWDNIRLLAVTAHVAPGDRARALAAGCDDYLSKPYLPADLFAAVTRVLGLTSAVPEPGGTAK